jgi:hypothetical protein
MSLLDQSQGETLRKFSTAIYPMVKALIQDNIHQSEPFTIESVETGNILELPKGSPVLLHLIR